MRKYNLNIQDISKRYLAGESEQKIAKSLGVSRSVIARRLAEAGIRRRTESEIRKLMWKKITSSTERKRLMSAAHAAIRDVTQSEEHRCKIAITREQRQIGIERAERILADKLRKYGLTITLQKAIGRYNVDIAIHEGSIAVEIFGGHWHGHGRHAARFRKRFDYLLNSGWLPIIIWVTKHFPLELKAIEYLVSLAKRRSSGESFRCQEHVIRGDGYMATKKTNPQKGTIIRTYESFYRRRGKNGRFFK